MECAANAVLACWFFAATAAAQEPTAAPPPASIAELRSAAEAGNAAAMTDLGGLYLSGDGVVADSRMGVDWLRRAAEAENAKALCLLGEFHFRGSYGVPLDRELAARHLCKSAEQDHAAAQTDLRRWFPGEHLELVHQEFDLLQEFAVGEPVLIEIESEGKAEFSTTRVGAGKTMTMTALRRLVDEFTEIQEEDWKCARTILLSHETVDGRVQDDDSTGARVEMQVVDGKSQLNVLDGRLMLEKSLTAMLDEVPGAGVDLTLPARAAIGWTGTVALDRLVPLLFDLDGELETALAELTFESFDAKTKLARLAGRGSLKERIDGTGGTLDVVFEFDLTVEMDLAAHRVASIVTTGRSTMKRRDNLADVRAKADFKVRLHTSGAEAARKALAGKPKFREVEHVREEMGVGFKLASHFFDLDAGPELQLLSHLAADQQAAVALRAFAIEAKTMEASMREAEVALANGVADASKPKDVRCALGRGRGVEFDNDGQHFIVEIYPLGKDRILRVRIFGTPAGLEARAQDLARFRASLKALAK